MISRICVFNGQISSMQVEINFKRNAPKVGKIKPDTEFFKDIRWFTTFLETFNGSVTIHKINICGCFSNGNGSQVCK